MSKKELLSESQIRRFMKLANLEPLTKNVVKENWSVEEENKKTVPETQTGLSMEEMEAPAMQPEQEGGEGEEVGLEMDSEGGEESLTADELKKAEEVLSAMFGKKVSLEAEGSEADEEEDAAEMADKEKDKEGEEEEEEEEMDETLSEDALVETVLARVTARLVAEAKKGKDKESTADKMDALRAKKKGAKKPAPKKPAPKKESLELKGDKLEEATSAEGGGPLLKQGKNKYDVYKGHADMTMAKGDKGGKGGHSLETAPAKAEHTVTHGGKNLATLGGNKTKV
jgi:hypothetical protein